jgi:fibro-slime domain-containing protein
MAINFDAGTGTGALLSQNQCGKNLTGVIRDFRMGAPPDFESVGAGLIAGKGGGDDKGIVLAELGADRKPVYAGPATGTITTTGPDNFHMWFNDVDGIDVKALYSIPFDEQTVPNPGQTITQYSYDNRTFFPLDNNDSWGYGNEGYPHNYGFTLEVHAAFVFHGWESFAFAGDDDVFVFINGHLAVDLGGIHLVESSALNFGEASLAAQFGLVPGNTCTFDLFYAERRTTMSDFTLTTTLAFQDCMVF